MNKEMKLVLSLAVASILSTGSVWANIDPKPGDEVASAVYNNTPPRKPTGGGQLQDSCGLFSSGHPYSCKEIKAADAIEACKQFPKGHKYSCENLAAMDTIMACSQFPKGHPYSCENLAALDMIKACNQFPTDHPYGCKRLLSFVPKCPPGEMPPMGCRQLLLENTAKTGILRDEDGNRRSVVNFGAFQSADISEDIAGGEAVK